MREVLRAQQAAWEEAGLQVRRAGPAAMRDAGPVGWRRITPCWLAEDHTLLAGGGSHPIGWRRITRHPADAV